MKIVTTEEMRTLEKATDAAGWTYNDMMEAAGKAVAAAIDTHLGHLANGPVLVLAGPGNNGGDGLVAARWLDAWEWDVRVYAWKRPGAKSDANFHQLTALDIPLAHAENDAERTQLRAWLADAVIVVDALLGTGVARPIAGDLAEILALTRQAVNEETRLISLSPPDSEGDDAAGVLFNLSEPLTELDRLNEAQLSKIEVVAVDCASGLDCASGVVDPATLPADYTVTFGFPKHGHFMGGGAEATGVLLVAEIGIPDDLADAIKIELVTPGMAAELLPARPRHAHKGTFGKALIVAGSVYFTGAAALAAQAATRAGAGLVTLGVARPLHGILAPSLLEVTWLPLAHDMGVLASDAARMINEKLAGYKALLIGPGLSTEKETGAFLKAFFQPEEPKARQRSVMGFAAAAPERAASSESKEGNKASAPRADLPPLVVDADALNWLAQQEDWAALLPPGSILTPHPGEMARLCKLEMDAVQAGRWDLAAAQAKAWNQIVVLKGAFTVIAAPDGRVRVLPFANPALATAGTGDVLAGAITALLAQGLAPFDAAVTGAYLHGLAGELAAEEIGLAGVVAEDIISYLPAAWRRLSGQ